MATLTCTSCIHALLHVPLDIRRTGPVWVNWSFVMERFCGILLPAVKSHVKPYTSLSTHLLHQSQLSQIALRYSLQDKLNYEDDVTEISSKERLYPEYPMSILRFPRVMRYKPSTQLRRQIAMHLATEYLKPVHIIEEALPIEMECWGKVRIADGGDCIRTSTTASNRAGRDQSFVRYDLLVDIYARHPKKRSVFETRCFYGQLQQILVCTLPAHELFKRVPRRRLFALVHTCETNGFDATLGLVTYTKMHSNTEIIEVTAISCVVGRVQVGRGKRWGIIDRSRDLVRPTFIEDPELVTGMEDTRE